MKKNYLAALIAVVALLTGCFAKDNEATASKSDAKPKVVNSKTKVSASTAEPLGEFHKEDKAFEELSNSKADIILTEEMVGDGFELFNFAEVQNEEGRILPGKIGENAINADSSQAAVSQILWNARHNEVELEDLLRGYNFNSRPGKYVVERDGKRYLSGDAIRHYLAVEEFLTGGVNVESGHYDILRTATTTGMQNGKLVQDNTPKDWSGYQMLKVSTKDGKETFYHNYYCANTLLPAPYGDVPQVKIPEPSVKPSKPEVKTPEKPATPPTTPTTPPTTTVVPKNVSESPTFNQGAGVVDNSPNPQTVWVEPSETYVAPQAPAAPVQQAPQSSTTTQPSGAWSGAGSFTDSNGATKVESNGAVSTPTQTLPELVGENVVVPEVENGFGSNVGVNNGYKSNNDIPMDD